MPRNPLPVAGRATQQALKHPASILSWIVNPGNGCVKHCVLTSWQPLCPCPGQGCLEVTGPPHTLMSPCVASVGMVVHAVGELLPSQGAGEPGLEQSWLLSASSKPGSECSGAQGGCEMHENVVFPSCYETCWYQGCRWVMLNRAKHCDDAPGLPWEVLPVLLDV